VIFVVNGAFYCHFTVLVYKSINKTYFASKIKKLNAKILTKINEPYIIIHLKQLKTQKKPHAHKKIEQL
jgi:hypothetical protein